MIFLIGKIFIYLVLAAGIGGAAGWLLRNMQAQRAEESAQRAMNDAKAKLPQLESLLRGRDEQITKLRDQMIEGKAQVSESDKNLRELEQKLRDQERLTKRWQQSAEAKNLDMSETFDLGDENAGAGTVVDTTPEDDQTDANNLIAELSQEIERLKRKIAEQPQATSGGADETLLMVEMDELREKLAKAERELQVALSDLVEEQNKVCELERERELQTKSLQVLHQQLELERTRRAANG